MTLKNKLRVLELFWNKLFHPSFITIEQDILKKITIGKGIDVGCGFRKVSENCIGVDIVPKDQLGRSGNVLGKKSVAEICADGRSLPFKNNELDFIVAKHNLEHYSNSSEVLKEWKRVLKKGGKIGVIVPDDRYVDTLTLDLDHKIKFTQAELEKLFLSQKFKIIESGVAMPHWSIYLIAKK